jgi:hypothetical protein
MELNLSSYELSSTGLMRIDSILDPLETFEYKMEEKPINQYS